MKKTKAKKSPVKKVVKKKTSIKPALKKKKTTKQVSVKKEENVSSNEIIFDSQVGKTDALFVDNPPTEAGPETSSEIKPDVKPAEEVKTAEINFLETTPKDPNQSQILASLNGKKKTFWQKLFSLFKKL